MEAEPNLLSAPEWYAQFARLAEKREAENGHPLENCPSSADLWSVVEIICAIVTGEENRTPAEVNAYMQKLATVSDKWVDPETDPIGARMYQPIEVLIESLGQTLDSSVPDACEQRRQWASVRVAAHCARRTAYRRSLNPSWIVKLFSKLRPARKVRSSTPPA